MAEILRYVDPNAAAGGDGTTNGLSGGTCAYVSLNAWEAATQQDLTDGGGDTARVVCSSDDAGSTHAADGAVCEINGWTSSATCNIQIESASSHGGKWNDAIYRRSIANNHALIIYEDYVNVIGLQISKSSSNSGVQALIIITLQGAANKINISKCILRQAGNATYSEPGIYVSDIDSLVDISNCIIYGLGANVSGDNSCISVSAGTVNVYNTTMVSGYEGLKRAGGTVVAKNCYAGNTAATDYIGTMTLTTCASEDATGSVGLQSIAYSTSTGAKFTNITGGSEDFHIQSGSSLIDVGTDLSGTFTDDIDGVARTGTWDIGADEYVAAGGSAIPVFMHHYLHNMGR